MEVLQSLNWIENRLRCVKLSSCTVSCIPESIWEFQNLSILMIFFKFLTALMSPDRTKHMSTVINMFLNFCWYCIEKIFENVYCRKNNTKTRNPSQIAGAHLRFEFDLPERFHHVFPHLVDRGVHTPCEGGEHYKHATKIMPTIQNK